MAPYNQILFLRIFIMRPSIKRYFHTVRLPDPLRINDNLYKGNAVF